MIPAQGHTTNWTFVPKGTPATPKERSEKVRWGYRFGFNGQEKDDEVFGATGTSYTAEFWQYDPRVARRWNLDPVPQISISDYAVFGLNPITNVDPNGAYFFGLVGSTKEQRQSARQFASENDGRVKDLMQKSVHVAFSYGEVNTTISGEKEFSVVGAKQYFNVDGSKWYENAIQAKVNDAWDDWSESEGFLGSTSYGIIDKGVLAYQGSPFGAVFYGPGERRHLNGTGATQSEVESGFFETAGTLMPAAKGPGILKRLNAAQFSKQFKGNLARMSSTSRGYANRAYNKGVDWINKGKGVAKGAATQLGKLLDDEDETNGE